MRVAAIQFENHGDANTNLNTIQGLIAEAAATGAALVVLPEFSNHLSWYDHDEHAWAVAVEQGDRFWQAMAQAARRHGIHLVVNVSLRRQKPAISVTSLLFGPDGECLLQADKQTLMGHENQFFVRATQASPVTEITVGEERARLGIFPCRDGVTFETPRCLALAGAQIFCDSLNSFALDEASLHVPARAPENKVFLVAANKVGPLIPLAHLKTVSEMTTIPERFLYGAGESQIVAPNGRVLAKAPRTGNAVIWADINPKDADNKLRPDGSDLFQCRRPSLYAALATPEQAITGPGRTATVALLRTQTDSADAHIEQACTQLMALPAGTDVAVLPELFWRGEEDVSDLAERTIQQTLVRRGDDLRVAFSRLASGRHLGLIVSRHGRELTQAQLHPIRRLPLDDYDDQLHTLDTPFGRLAVLVGDDAALPETIKLLALKGVHLVLLPWRGQELWEQHLGLPSRAAENRLCIAAATQADDVCNGLVADLHTEFTLMQPWLQREFDGHINHPLLTAQAGPVTLASLHLAACANKLMSENTDLLAQRPWRLCAPLVTEICP